MLEASCGICLCRHRRGGGSAGMRPSWRLRGSRARVACAGLLSLGHQAECLSVSQKDRSPLAHGGARKKGDLVGPHSVWKTKLPGQLQGDAMHTLRPQGSCPGLGMGEPGHSGPRKLVRTLALEAEETDSHTGSVPTSSGRSHTLTSRLAAPVSDGASTRPTEYLAPGRASQSIHETEWEFGRARSRDPSLGTLAPAPP